MINSRLHHSERLILSKDIAISDYATVHEMKLNMKKTKFMLFNPTINYDFVPDLSLEGVDLETMDEIRLLGLIVRSDLEVKH